MQVFQTAGVPPSDGMASLPTSGCTRNSKVALAKRVRAKAPRTSTGNGKGGTSYGDVTGPRRAVGYPKERTPKCKRFRAPHSPVPSPTRGRGEERLEEQPRI